MCVCAHTRFPGHSSWDDDKISTLQSPIELFRTKVSTNLIGEWKEAKEVCG